MKHHNRFGSEKKREVVHERLELTILTLSAHMQYLSKKKKESCLCEAPTHDLHVIVQPLPHRNCPNTLETKSKQTFNITQTDTLRTPPCGARSASSQ